MGIWIGWAITCNCFTPPEVSFSHFQSSSTVSYILSTLTQTGMLAITDIPELAATRQWALSSVQECLSSEVKHGAEALLPDGTVRHTLVLKDNILSDCPQIQPQLRSLRDLVQKASNLIAMALDQSKINVQIEMIDGKTLTSMAQILSQAKQLDHFHLYEGNSTAHSVAMDIHLDAGIFIAFVPPLWKDHKDDQDSGLLIQLPNGEIEPVVLNENTVVIMVGLGAQRFLQIPLRPVPHALQVFQGTLRSWYGRMILVPDDMILDRNISFQEFWSKSHEEIVSGLGCSPTSKEILGEHFNGLIDPANPACPVNTTDCWSMSPGNVCLRDIECPVGETTLCWADNSPMGPHMCVNATDCKLKCNQTTFSWI